MKRLALLLALLVSLPAFGQWPAWSRNTTILPDTVTATTQFVGPNVTSNTVPAWAINPNNSIGIGQGTNNDILFFQSASPGMSMTSTSLNIRSDGALQWRPNTSYGSGQDTGISRIAAGITGFGTGAAAAVDGTVAATNYRIAAVPAILGAAPTLGSGGCTSPTAVTANGTAAFSIGVGTGCSGSQPLIFTLAAATTGWMCTARNSTNGATSAPAQTGAVSTTSVTITNFVRTTGVAGAWTASDNVVVSCMGY